MSEAIHALPPLPPVAPTGKADGGGAAAATDSPAFRRLLERLQNVTAPAAHEVQDAQGLAQAMRGATDSFVETMELRRALEAAFRART